MRNRRFNSFIIWLLIASPLWWTCGCYTTTVVSDARTLKSEKITVTTKNGKTYELVKWQSDSIGNVVGKGAEVDHSQKFAYKPFADTIASSNIRTVSSHELNAGLTVMAVTGAVVGILLAWLIVFVETLRGPV